VEIEALCARYPVLFHMAEHDSFSSIQKHGLRSTSALLDLFEVRGSERVEIESCWRPNPVAISHPSHGVALIRDQKPMPVAKLLRCLQGMTPREWYELLNHKTFFWATSKRVHTLLNAMANRDRKHLVLRVDTRSLLQQYASTVTLCMINSGAALYNNPPKRGLDIFPNRGL
jgi:hypothetical protein